MQILDIQIDKHPVKHYPRFDIYLLVDKIPDRLEMRFQQKGNRWFAEHGGYVRYFGWEPGGNNGGFYGRHFDIITKDETKVTLLGPWSSRSSAMNKEGFTPSLEVSITEDPEVMKRGHTFYAVAVTVELLRPVLEKMGERLVEIDSHGEPQWVLESTLETEDEPCLDQQIDDTEDLCNHVPRAADGNYLPQSKDKLHICTSEFVVNLAILTLVKALQKVDFTQADK